MKRIIWNFFFASIILSPAPAQVSFGEPEKINESWYFTLADPAEAQIPGLDTRRWQSVDLPHDWSVQGQLSPTLASCTGYLPGGIGWYRKTLDIPVEKTGKKVYLYFEGVYNRSQVYLNGHLLGERPNGYISFLYDATPYIQYGKPNTIAVRVDHSRSADSRWYTGSGIYRDVWLITTDSLHIGQWGIFVTTSQPSANRGELSVEIELENGSASVQQVTVVNELLDTDGAVIAQTSRKTTLAAASNSSLTEKIRVKNPRFWNLDDPYLYTLKTTLYRQGEVIDRTETPVGIRTMRFDPDKGFALNGAWIKMKGVCLHHDAGVLGAAVPRAVWRRRLESLKEIGCNAIRTSHNPQAPDLYDLCDELGLLVLNEAFDEWEFPKRKWLEGWNVGVPGYESSCDFFEAWMERDMADFVRRDRNHPSVFAWSIGNEVDYPNDPYSHPVLGGEHAGDFTQASYGGYKPDAPDANRLGDIAKRLVAVVKQYDPSRPTTAGLAGVAMSNETEYPGALDIAGYNYTESRYRSDHEKYPERVIYGSENRHDKAAWDAVTQNDHIFGQFLWTGIDYLGESRKWPSRGFGSGLLDLAGFLKPRGYFRQSLWSDSPMAYLGTYSAPRDRNQAPSMDAWPVWNYAEGQTIRMVCFTNAARARLTLNGKTVGETKPYDPKTGIIFWDIPYEPGKLEVNGMDEHGNIVSSYAIESSGRPHALEVVCTQTEIAKEKGLLQLEVRVMDENGIPVMLSDDEVTCRITGPARLLGLESGDNSDMSDYTDNKHRVYHGRIRAYLQATGESGEAVIRFTAPWLIPAEYKITVK